MLKSGATDRPYLNPASRGWLPAAAPLLSMAVDRRPKNIYAASIFDFKLLEDEGLRATPRGHGCARTLRHTGIGIIMHRRGIIAHGPGREKVESGKGRELKV